MTRRVARAAAAVALLLAVLPASAGAEYRFGYVFGDPAPNGVAVDPAGNVYATVGNQVDKFSPGGSLVDQWGAMGAGAGQLVNPRGLDVDPSGNVYVADTVNNRIDKFSPAGAFVAAWGWGVTDGANAFQICTTTCRAGANGPGDRQFTSPKAIATDAAGDVFVADTGNQRVQRLRSDGTFVKKFAASGADGIAVDADDNAYVSDDSGSVTSYDANGAASGTPLSLPTPEGLAVDDDGNVYAAADANVVKRAPGVTTPLATLPATGARDVALAPDGAVIAAVDGGLERYDAIAPVTTIDSAPSGLIETASATFGFHASIAGSRFECRMQGGDDFAPCTSPVTADGLFAGLNVFAVRAIDGAGIRERDPATADFTVDGAGGPPGFDGFDGLDGLPGLDGERGPRGRRGPAGGLVVKVRKPKVLRAGATLHVGLKPSVAVQRVRVELRLGSSRGAVVADGARKRLPAGKTTEVRLRVVRASAATKLVVVVHGRTAGGKAVLLSKAL